VNRLIFELILPILGLVVGIVAAMLGIGGGVFVVPILQLLLGFDPILAAGTSLAMIVFKALSSTSSYARQKRIDYKVGLLLVTLTIPGAFVGAYLADAAAVAGARNALRLIFALFLFYVASRMISSYRFGNLNLLRNGPKWTRKLTDSDEQIFTYSVDLGVGVVLSFFAGLAAGLLGIGGGALMVPILHFGLSLPMHLAIATSVFIMVFTSISGVASRVYFESVGTVQHINWTYSLLLSIGVIVGAQIGAHASKRVSALNLRRIFGFVLMVIGLSMVAKAFAGA
jgi:uncharacterized membrane protein YfcA